jgi:putative FmdB family regulatory protein
MPTYDYQCEKCHKAFEIFQSMKDPVFTICPKDHCQRKTWGKGKVKRQVGTGAGLIFKGSGFYITDYRSEGYKDAAKTAAKSESGGGGESKSGETKGSEAKVGEKPKTDAKPAPAEKPKPAPKTKKD